MKRRVSIVESISTNGHSTPPPVGSSEESELSLHELLEIVRKGKFLILTCFFAVLALTALYTFTTAKQYQAKSSIQVNTQNATPQIGELFGFENAFRNVLNEIEILRSRSIAIQVAEQLMAMPRRTGENQFVSLAPPDDGSQLTAETVVGRLREDIVTISPVSEDVDFIAVSATSTNPFEASIIANLYAENYVEYNRAASRERMKAAVDYLSEVTDNYQSDLQMSETALLGFRSEASVVSPEEEARQLLTQRAELERLKFESESHLGAARAELAGLEDALNRMLPGLSRRLASADGQILEQLGKQIAEKVVEREQRLAKNPQLKTEPDAELTSLDSQIASLRSRMDELSAAIVESDPTLADNTLSTDQTLKAVSELRAQVQEKKIEVNAVEARLEPIKRNLVTLNAERQRLPGKELRVEQLQRTVDTRGQLYTDLIRKLQEARIAEESELGYVEVIDQAVVPVRHVSPKVPLNLMLGALLGLMLGIAVAFVRNALDNKVRTPEDVRKMGLSVIGAIPNLDKIIKADFDGQKRVSLNGSSYDTSLITLLNPLSPVSEGYRRLRTNIQFSDPDRETKIVMVTSAEPGEGKTVTSANLAIAYAQSGRRTAYVDTDLRRAKGHKVFGVPREPGVVDILFDTVPPNLERFASHVDDLYVIPAGRNVPNPGEVLESHKMQDFLRRLRAEFDVVVVDTPPVLAVADALMLTRSADACILVCGANSTTVHALESSFSMMKDLGANVIGVMLNKIDSLSGSGYGYGYGYTYRSYYGDKPTPKTAAKAS